MAKSDMSESDGSDVESSPCNGSDSNNPPNNNNNNTEKESVCIIKKPIKTSTPVSIVVQSLIMNLCGIYEPDTKNALKLYNLICDKLYEMTIIDESYSMNEFEGIRNQYQRAFHRLLTSARDSEQGPLCTVWPNNELTNEWSHYHREFDEISYIAGGGFGQVFRVKHKLDGTEYAIKKIFIRSEGIQSVMNYLSEVKTFASLNHSNIVQYKAAWLEPATSSAAPNFEQDEIDFDYYTATESEYTEECTKSHVDTYLYPDVLTNVDSMEFKVDDSSDFQVSFEKSGHYSYTHTEKKSKRVKRSSISEGGNAICTVEEIKRMRDKYQPRWATLYIQMSLCQSTLKQWLETRNVNEAENPSALVPLNNHRTQTVMEILTQLLKGLEYIHSKGIVHHDIKPSNIFMQLENGSLLVQLGDFGLACPLQSTKHSLAFGTKLYAAPEQLSGKCDPKSDMYSLGIVTLELIETFRTDMERVQSITDLRKENLSSKLCTEYPKLANIISQLVIRHPSKRPDANTLLKLISVNVAESDVVRDLQTQLAEKDEEISRLREMLKNVGIDS